MRFAREGLVAVAVMMLAGCKVYDASMLLPAEAGCAPGAGQTSGLGVGWWSGCDQSGTCFSARSPSSTYRPAQSDPSTQDLTLLFGIRSMRLGSRNINGELDKDAWQDIGYDLDGLCTASPTCPMEGEPPQPCLVQGNLVPTDGKSCRDNTFGRLEYMAETTEEFGDKYRLNEGNFNCSICQGAYNFIFRLQGYNGQANDSAVRVDIYPSPGLTELKQGVVCDGAPWDPGACWTRDDIWTVQQSYVPSGQGGPEIGESSLYDPTAFVRDWQIVVALRENTVLWFPSTTASARAFPMKLQGGLVSGRLVPVADGWLLADGLISGRMIWTDALDAFRKLGLCDGDPVFTAARMFAKTYADVLSTGALSPETPCDAISVGVSFNAELAQVGELREVPELLPCSDAGAADAAPEDAAAADAGTD